MALSIPAPIYGKAPPLLKKNTSSSGSLCKQTSTEEKRSTGSQCSIEEIKRSIYTRECAWEISTST